MKAVGTVSRNDYETVIEPLVNGARSEGRRIRLLYEFGPEFRSFTPGAGWEDFKIGISWSRSNSPCAPRTVKADRVRLSSLVGRDPHAAGHAGRNAVPTAMVTAVVTDPMRSP
ncbi:STAS/SEC14 domain-containing protein [Streptomyces sp. NPDC048506]|uniref:STAS/SEC14 domain-containing protein n=1 Tax=Streptomyces sp. NPDC048506 TaxID=3155028 RepID=UPI00342B14F7